MENKNILKEDLPQKLKVYLSDKVWHKMQYLCTHIDKVEWSGCIFYDIKGSLFNPESIKINILDLIPLDKGSEAFTTYNFDERVLNYMVAMDYLEHKIGHCHSHHNMNTFFSGTDLSELYENSETIKPYLSIIINNRYDFSCKLAFRTTKLMKYKYQYQDIDYSKCELEDYKETEVIMIYDCDVIAPKKELIVDGLFLQQFKDINKPKKVISTTKSNLKPIGFKNQNQTYQTNLFDFGNDYDIDMHYSINDIKSTKKQDDFILGLNDFISVTDEFTCYVLNLGKKITSLDITKAINNFDNMYEHSKEFDLLLYADVIREEFEMHFKDYHNIKEISEDDLGIYYDRFLNNLYDMAFETESIFLNSLLHILDNE
jgi:hypothetical protein